MLRKKIRQVNDSHRKPLYNVTEMRLYSADNEKIELEFKPMYIPEDRAVDWDDFNRYDSMMIFQTDYERLLSPLIDSLYPLTAPDTGEVENALDYCFENFIGSDDRTQLLVLIEEKAHTCADEEREFYNELLLFLKEAEKKSPYLCIEGNL
ncbi:hypothetical protein [uncultured Ruminococcus sp.]|uniref:hypothetical protein n=1 Tax=uncultured Ruminococcus sp. TaxID=165186 RepID=UPI0025DC0E8C|nr:hypothetical protein [uncultured Ruminococcus sp.]